VDRSGGTGVCRQIDPLHHRTSMDFSAEIDIGRFSEESKGYLALFTRHKALSKVAIKSVG
jgi:hypothetical protein